jgi:hypothetical protein
MKNGVCVDYRYSHTTMIGIYAIRKVVVLVFFSLALIFQHFPESNNNDENDNDQRRRKRRRTNKIRPTRTTPAVLISGTDNHDNVFVLQVLLYDILG